MLVNLPVVTEDLDGPLLLGYVEIRCAVLRSGPLRANWNRPPSDRSECFIELVLVLSFQSPICRCAGHFLPLGGMS